MYGTPNHSASGIGLFHFTVFCVFALWLLDISSSGDGFLLQTLVPASYLELERAVLAKAKSFQEAKQYPVLNAKQFK